VFVIEKSFILSGLLSTIVVSVEDVPCNSFKRYLQIISDSLLLKLLPTEEFGFKVCCLIFDALNDELQSVISDISPLKDAEPIYNFDSVIAAADACIASTTLHPVSNAA